MIQIKRNSIITLLIPFILITCGCLSFESSDDYSYEMKITLKINENIGNFNYYIHIPIHCQLDYTNESFSKLFQIEDDLASIGFIKRPKSSFINLSGENSFTFHFKKSFDDDSQLQDFKEKMPSLNESYIPEGFNRTNKEIKRTIFIFYHSNEIDINNYFELNIYIEDAPFLEYGISGDLDNVWNELEVFSLYAAAD